MSKTLRLPIVVTVSLVLAFPLIVVAYGGAHVGTTHVTPTGTYHTTAPAAAVRVDQLKAAWPRMPSPSSVFFGDNKAIHYSPVFHAYGYQSASHGDIGLNVPASFLYR